MKIIRAMIDKVRTEENGTTFSYPNGWVDTKINVLAFEDSDTLGNVAEYCIAIIHDDTYAQQLIDGSSGQVIEIDEATANTLGDTCKPQQLITDNNKLGEMLIAIDKPPGERSQEEIDMLNPDHQTEGIRRTPQFNVQTWIPE